MKGERLAEFEELVLLAVYALGENAYGVTVQEKLERDAARPVSLGAVYAVLDRLERKGWLRSRVGGATRERGGRRKRFFAITRAGVAAVREARRIRERIWDAIEAES